MSWTDRLRIHHLHLLITLTETGSLSDTARLVKSTQPRLSKWLKDLEVDIGAPIFERHPRGLKPTPIGLSLMAHAQRVLSEMKRAEKNLEALRGGYFTSVALGTSPAAAARLIPDAISYFLKANPLVKVTLTENTMDQNLEKLERGELDVAVGRLDGYQPRATLHSELLYNEPIKIVARPGHPLTSRTMCWDDLYEYEWIHWPEGTPIRTQLDDAISHAGLKPLACRVESSSLMSNLWLLQSSDLLSVVSGRVAEHFQSRGLIVPLDFNLGSAGSIGMCWRDDPLPDSSTSELLASLRKAAKEPLREP